MGYSNWSDAAYQSRQSYRQQTQQTAFTLSLIHISEPTRPY